MERLSASRHAMEEAVSAFGQEATLWKLSEQLELESQEAALKQSITLKQIRAEQDGVMGPVYRQEGELLNAGELLTPNLVGGSTGGTVSGTGGVTALPPTISGSVSGNTGSYTSVKYTPVTEELYYSGGYLGTLGIPTLGLSVRVYQGTDADALRNGVGHFADTSIWDGNVAIAGHNRGVNNYFGKIHTLNVGDTIQLTTRLGTRSYEVCSVAKISADDTGVLNDSAENIITLITCVMDQPDYRWCVQAREK